MKKYFTLFVLLLLSFASSAQYDLEDVESDSISKDPKLNPFKLKEKIYVGSGLNALFGSRTFIYVSPFIGYDITPKFSAGIGTMYQYYRENFNGNIGYLHSIGGGVFTRFRPIEQLILETSINTYSTTYNGVSESKVRSNSWMLGLGYANSIGGKAYYQVMIQYDLFKNSDVPEPLLMQFSNGGRVYYKFGLVFYLSNS
jgi:hypothetical protein